MDSKDKVTGWIILIKLINVRKSKCATNLKVFIKKIVFIWT